MFLRCLAALLAMIPLHYVWEEGLPAKHFHGAVFQFLMYKNLFFLFPFSALLGALFLMSHWRPARIHRARLLRSR